MKEQSERSDLSRGKVRHQSCNLLRSAQTSHGLPGYELLLGSVGVFALIDSVVPGGRLHSAGTDGIAADLKQERFAGGDWRCSLPPFAPPGLLPGF